MAHAHRRECYRARVQTVKESAQVYSSAVCGRAKHASVTSRRTPRRTEATVSSPRSPAPLERERTEATHPKHLLPLSLVLVPRKVQLEPLSAHERVIERLDARGAVVGKDELRGGGGVEGGPGGVCTCGARERGSDVGGSAGESSVPWWEQTQEQKDACVKERERARKRTYPAPPSWQTQPTSSRPPSPSPHPPSPLAPSPPSPSPRRPPTGCAS